MPTMNVIAIMQILAEWMKRITREMNHYEELHHLDEVTIEFIHSQNNARRCKVLLHYEGEDVNDLIFIVEKFERSWFQKLILGDKEQIAYYEEQNLMNTQKLEELLLKFFDMMAVEKVFYIDFQENQIIMRVVGNENFMQFTFNGDKIEENVQMGYAREISQNTFQVIQTLNYKEQPNPVLPFAEKLFSYFKKQ